MALVFSPQVSASTTSDCPELFRQLSLVVCCSQLHSRGFHSSRFIYLLTLQDVRPLEPLPSPRAGSGEASRRRKGGRSECLEGRVWLSLVRFSWERAKALRQAQPWQDGNTCLHHARGNPVSFASLCPYLPTSLPSSRAALLLPHSQCIGDEAVIRISWGPAGGLLFRPLGCDAKHAASRGER